MREKIRQFKNQITFILIATILICGFCLFFTSNTVTAFAEDSMANGTHFEIEKNNIEAVYVSSERNESQRGELIALSVEVYPENARLTVVDTSFRIIVGSNFATIENGYARINETAPIGSRVVIMAEVDGVESSNAVTLTVKNTPVESIEFISDDTEIVIGGSYMLDTIVYPMDATNKTVYYSVVSGSSFVNMSYNGVLSFKDNVSIPDDCSITVRAASADSSGVFAEKSFKLVAPKFDPIFADNSLTGVEQQRVYSFDIAHEPYSSLFGNRAVYYSIDVSSDIATIDLHGSLYIKPEAPIGTHIIVSLDANDGTHYSQNLEVVPVFATSFSPVLLTAPTARWGDKNYYLPGDILCFDVVAFYPLNVSSCNKEFQLRISDSSLATIDGIRVIINDKISNVNPHLTVTVVSAPNGLEQSFEIDIFIALSAINLVSNVVELREDNSYAISNIVRSAITPENAMYQPIEYFIESESSDIAVLRNDTIYIRDDLPSGNITIGLYAVTEGIRSNTVWYNIYKPTRTLSLEADNYEPISSNNIGETITLFTTVDENASMHSPSYIIEMGVDFINGDIQYVESLPDGRAKWQFTIKKQLALLNKITPIVLYAEQDGTRSNIITFNIHIPDEALAVKEANVNRGSTHKISFTHTQNTTDKSVEWSIVTDGISKVANSANEFFVPKNLAAGTKIKIKYRSGDKTFFGNNGAWKYATFTVARLSDTDYPDSHNVYDNGILYSGFNTVFGTDNGGYVIGKNGSTPQLWHGRSTQIHLYYSNSSICDYGMSISGITVSGVAEEQAKNRTNDSFVIKANESAKANEEIVITIKVTDGNVIYTLHEVTLYAFRELSGELKFNTITKTGDRITDFVNKNNSTFDFNANDGIGALKFAVFNYNGFGINNGIINATSYTAYKEQQIRYSYTQTYNGMQLAEYSEDVTLVLRTVSLDNAVGEGRNYFGEGPSYYIALQGMFNSVKTINTLPSFAGLMFDGYGDYIDRDGSVLYDLYSCNYTLSAKWKPNEYSTDIDNEKEINDDCEYYMYSDTIDPNFNIKALKELGYKKIKITIKYKCHEIDDGYQDIYIFSGSDSNIIASERRDDEGSSWHSVTLNFEISIDKFKSNSASFYIGWGAYGAWSDNWMLGARTVTVKAI